MSLISAKDYLATQPHAALDGHGHGAELDPQQPDVGFSFGSQPAATRNADIIGSGKRRKVGIVGAGDVYKKFLLPTFAQRGTDLFITSVAGAEAAVDAARHNGLHAEAVESIGAMPKDLDYILVLTPPGAHLPNIEEAMKTGLPIVVEKPLAGNAEDATAIEDMLKDYKAPVYCIDWEVMHAMPLLSAVGVNVPFTDALEQENAHRFQEFDFKHITHIDGRFVEGGDNSLGDIDYVKKHRPWLFDYCQGGGMLYDLAVHPLNVLAALGFRDAGIEDVKLGTPIKEGTDDQGKPVYKKGTYARFGKMPPGEKTGEIYGRANMALQLDGQGAPIETVIEVAKGAKVNDGRIVLEDVKGQKLQWDMFPLDKNNERIPGSTLRMYDMSGREVASSNLQADCYALIAEDIARFMDREKAQGTATKLYLPEHTAMIHSVADMHDFARRRDVQPGETVTQLAVEKPEIKRADMFAPRDPHKADGTGFARGIAEDRSASQA